jgi:AcrR family transcriptional regulator
VTRDRLLAAAVASCVGRGFEGATVADIADRAEVSGPAIYKHFGGKAELLVAAGRSALDALRPVSGGPLRAADITRLFTAPEFADTRRLLTELHLAALRHPDVAVLVGRWQHEHLEVWLRHCSGRNRKATVKVFFALLLGLCQLDALAAVDAPVGAVRNRVDDLIAVLFPDHVEAVA